MVYQFTRGVSPWKISTSQDTLDALGCSDNVELKAVPKGHTADASIASGAAVVDPNSKAGCKEVSNPPKTMLFTVVDSGEYWIIMVNDGYIWLVVWKIYWCSILLL